MDLFFVQNQTHFWYQNWIDFGSKNGPILVPKLGPFWVQNWTKFRPIFGPISDRNPAQRGTWLGPPNATDNVARTAEWAPEPQISLFKN